MHKAALTAGNLLQTVVSSICFQSNLLLERLIGQNKIGCAPKQQGKHFYQKYSSIADFASSIRPSIDNNTNRRTTTFVTSFTLELPRQPAKRKAAPVVPLTIFPNFFWLQLLVRNRHYQNSETLTKQLLTSLVLQPAAAAAGRHSPSPASLAAVECCHNGCANLGTAGLRDLPPV